MQSTGVRELHAPVRIVSILVLLYAMRVMLCAVRDRKGVRTVRASLFYHTRVGCKLRITYCTEDETGFVNEELRRLTNAIGDTKTENVF